MVAWKIHVPDALDARVRRRMGESGESLSHVVRAAVDSYLHDVPPVMTVRDAARRGAASHGAHAVGHELKFLVSDAQWERLKAHANTAGVSMGGMARTAIDEWLDRLEERQPSLFD